MADRIRRALVSVYDKTGLDDLARGLARHGVEIISTGSTAGRIRDAGAPVTEVADLTGFPECLDGRVKTLHPRIHAGLLADRSKAEHLRELEELRVQPIDLVVSNLYPFQDAVASGASDDEIIEKIDIGGPTMLRAAAKNFAHVAIVCEQPDYRWIIERLDAAGGLTLDERRMLATRAFDHAAVYDAAIACLDLATCYARRRRLPDLQKLALEMFPVFTSREIHREALAALLLLRDQLSSGRAEVSFLEEIRAFLEDSRYDRRRRFREPRP